MKDLILGAFTNYDYIQLQYWINSIKMSGFDGDIVVVVGNTSFQTVEKLIQKGVKIIAFNKDDENKIFTLNSNIPIHTERFFHYWNFLKDHWHDYRYVIATDMRDVIFQFNPSIWLENNIGDDYEKIVSSTECLKYKDEPWGRENLQQGFGPYFYECWKDFEIQNVGVLAGHSEYMKDLFLSIFQMSINRPIAIVEQAAYNALIRTTPWTDITLFVPMCEGWVCHLGTTMQEEFVPFLQEDGAVWSPQNDVVQTTDGLIFSVVHQYDRVPELKAYIEEKYGDKQ